MANPQVEDGNTRFANELLEAIIKAKFSGSEVAILLAVARKTYGWQQKTDNISIGQFVQLTGLTHRGVCKATLSLVNKKALGREQKGTTYVTSYWIEKDYTKWYLSSEQKGTSEQLFTKTSEQTGIQLVNKKAPTKETIQKKERNTEKKQLLLKQHQSFEVTWSLYPRKLGKDRAFKNYCKTVLTAEQAKQCKRAVENYLAEIEDKGTEDKYQLHGDTFMGRWKDYYNLKPFEADQEQPDMIYEEMK